MGSHGCCLCGAFIATYFLNRFIDACWQSLAQLVSQWFCSPKRLRDYGKWAVVTGSTDGIGKEMALALARSGLSVMIIGRNDERVKATTKEVGAVCCSGEEARSLLVDFTKPNYDEIQRNLSDLDVGILVNNVGMSYPSAQYLSDLSAEILDQLVDVNLRSAIRMSHIVYPGMSSRKRGAIICVGSGASQLPSEPLYAAYAGVKGGVEAFCRSLQVEAATYGILVQCHVPLLITSKLSKIRTPSVTVPSAKHYAQCAIETIKRGCRHGHPSKSPYLGHTVMFGAISLIPRPVWNWYRLGQTKQIRSRYMKKIQDKKV